MRLHILSDLHLGSAGFEPPETDADVVVLAGDIARPRESVPWAMQFAKPVLYVAGNHEFYGGSIDGTLGALRRACAGSSIQVLDGDEIVLGGVRFLGATLWTDFELFNDAARKAEAMAEAQRLIRDFSRIRREEASDAVFTPQDSVALFRRQASWLSQRLAAPFDGPTVVITHHAPSTGSIHPRFTDSLLNACFVSAGERLLDGTRAPLWIHGHTHDSFDYRVNGTRVLCNPRGYAKDGVNENPCFDPALVIDIGG
jgi:predicted phosphodiesterase